MVLFVIVLCPVMGFGQADGVGAEAGDRPEEPKIADGSDEHKALLADAKEKLTAAMDRMDSVFSKALAAYEGGGVELDELLALHRWMIAFTGDSMLPVAPKVERLGKHLAEAERIVELARARLRDDGGATEFEVELATAHALAAAYTHANAKLLLVDRPRRRIVPAPR